MDYETLKTHHRKVRDDYPLSLNLRIHRALSWLNRAEQCDDGDGQFIFLWIAFNAAYANEIGEGEKSPEQKIFGQFITKLVDLDKGDTLYNLMWQEFPGCVRVLLDNKYVFKPFWDYHNGKISEEQWDSSFKSAKQAASRALAEHRPTAVFTAVLSRMYTLRNQLMHGGATWNSAVNRDQIRDCSALLGKIVPFIIQLMLDNPGTLWGDACYPVIED